jgi:streptogramin lyase
MPNGNVQAITTTGTTITFVPSGGEFTSPAGYQTLVLHEKSKSPLEYELADAAGDATIFKRASSASEEAPVLVPASVEQATGAGGLDKVTYDFTKTTEGIVEPTELIAPYPSSLHCAETLEQGCRALEFKYGTATHAEESESGWGEYIGRLMEVKAVMWSMTAKKMVPVPVAQYAYDAKGRLRAEWNPQVETSKDCGETCPALKTIYGYDSEGHVTAITPPGQEPWVFTYGTSASDTNGGRLLKVVQAPSSTKCEGSCYAPPPSNSELPILSGTPAVGVRLAVSNGVWSNAPVAYAYAWERCNSSGKECSPIAGATNANYTATNADAGDKLVAQVTATNGGGSVTAVTTASAVVLGRRSDVEQAIDAGNSLNGVSCFSSATCVVVDSAGKAYYATGAIGSLPVTWTAWSGPSGESPAHAIACTEGEEGPLCLLADGKGAYGGNLYYAKSLGGSWSEAYAPTFGIDAVSCVSSSLCVAGQDGVGLFRYSTKPASTSWTYEEQEHTGATAMQGVSCVRATSFCAMATNEGRVLVATSTSQIESSSWTETDVDGTTALNAISCESTTSCVAVDAAGDVVDLTIESGGGAKASIHDIDGTTPLSGVSCAGSECIAADSAGHVFVSSSKGETWTQKFSFADKLTSLSCIGTSVCATVDTTGNVIGLHPEGETTIEGEERPPQPGTTIEYNVPVSGAGAPNNMSASEVERWGEKEHPAEAAAIFPADKPQGWPTSSYERATVYYLDASEHTVNVATPAGGISTAEYDAHGDTTRTLSADNRAEALSQGSKSAEVAKPLYNESKYNGEGTELEETLGPEHTVKLPNGAEVKARKQVRYVYNEEGAPAGGPYRLPTETSEAALIAGSTEDRRSIKNSYSGQENLGWKLHAPTSTTTAPNSLKLVHHMTYSTSTGAEIEDSTPDAEPRIAEYPLASGFQPTQITSGPDGNLWVTDDASGKPGKIVKLTTSGVRSGEYATEGSEPAGITAGPDGNLWLVEHSSTGRVDHITTSGTLTNYTLSRTGTYNTAITTGPDGNLWFTESETGYVGKITTKDEVLDETKLPSGSKPNAIAVGPDKNLWVADFGTSEVTKLNTNGEILGETKLPANSEPYAIAVGADGNLWVTEENTSKVAKINTKGELLAEYGLAPESIPQGIASGPEGDLWVADYSTSKLAKLTTAGSVKEISLPAGSYPRSITIGPERNIWFTEYGTNRIGMIVPDSGEGHSSQTIDYTTKTEASVATCQNHPEWAGLPCQTQPVTQPQAQGLPALPVTTITYNIWDEPETTKTSSGEGGEAPTRTEKDTYDPAGRLLTRELTSSTGTGLPAVSYQYGAENGQLVKQSTGTGGSEQKITQEYNRYGQLSSYSDAAGKSTSYEYEPEKDARLLKVSDEKGSQTYAYNTTTGLPTSLKDSSAGTFTSGYDVEGNPVSETLPNGLTATTTRNPAGEPVALKYVKETHCSEHCEWFYDNVVPSIHGQWMSQASSLATDNYTYNEAGWLTQTQETPTGKTCAVRLYAYDADGNRTSLTRRPPTAGCATEGGETEYHTYDTADRLIDPEVSYDPFGDITSLSSTDAGGSGALASGFYTDGQLASQTQAGQTIGYELDPARRTNETISTGHTTATYTSNYDGPGATPTWLAYTSGEWQRNIYGLSGALAATQSDTETPVMQVANLHGDIIAVPLRPRVLRASTKCREYSPASLSVFGGFRPCSLAFAVL